MVSIIAGGLRLRRVAVKMRLAASWLLSWLVWWWRSESAEPIAEYSVAAVQVQS